VRKLGIEEGWVKPIDSTTSLMAGGAVIAGAACLGGAAGFGTALVSTPLLLLLGFPLPFVITLNLSMNMLTRMSVTYQLRAHVTRRSWMLILGSIPGLVLGVVVLTSISAHAIKLGTGVAVLVLTFLVARAVDAPPPRPLPGAPLAAGLAGGFLGSTTSLNGMPAVLLLAHDKVAPKSFLADLAVYFVLSNAIALIILRFGNALNTSALFPTLLLWLPGSLIGNYLGVRFGTRLPERIFRWFTITVAVVSGIMTLVTA
jgi:hypothetical protein